MEDEDITQPIKNVNPLTIALIFGIIFLVYGSYNIGYNNGYTYMLDYQNEYKVRNCECFDPRTDIPQNKIIKKGIPQLTNYSFS